MGHEILYCSLCQQQIRWQDLEAGKAFKLENRSFCLNCGPDVLKTLPRDRVREIFKAAAAYKGDGPPSTSRRVAPPRDTSPTGSIKKPLIGMLGLIAALAISVGVVVFVMARPSAEAPDPPSVRPGEAARPKPEAVVRAPSPSPSPVAAPSAPAPPPPQTPSKAAEALKSARQWAAEHPTDFNEAIRKFQEAAFLATGTPLEAEATRELETLRKKQRDFFAAELASVEPEVREACRQERFMKALEILATVRPRHPGTEWDLVVGKRFRDVNDEAFRLLDHIKKEALAAQERGEQDKVDVLRSRVAGWGVPQLIKEFREAVDE